MNKDVKSVLANEDVIAGLIGLLLMIIFAPISAMYAYLTKKTIIFVVKDKGTITITTEYECNKLFVKIKDTGCGIPENHLSKIFTAGFTTKSHGVGTGLGLAICKKIIEKHNGELIVNSEIGKGSEFIITICSE